METTTDWGVIGLAVSVFTLVLTIVGLYIANKHKSKD